MDKKRLYESIMHHISRTVKDALNEKEEFATEPYPEYLAVCIENPRPVGDCVVHVGFFSTPELAMDVIERKLPDCEYEIGRLRYKTFDEMTELVYPDWRAFADVDLDLYGYYDFSKNRYYERCLSDRPFKPLEPIRKLVLKIRARLIKD